MLELLFLSRHKIDAEHIETDEWSCLLRQLAHVMASQPANGVSLVGVDGGFGGRDVMRGAGLHFDDAKQRSIPRNQVEIAGYGSG